MEGAEAPERLPLLLELHILGYDGNDITNSLDLLN